MAMSVLVALALVLSPIGTGTSQATASDVTVTASASSSLINELGSTTVTLNISYGTGAPYGIGSWVVDLPYDASKFTVGTCTPISAQCNPSYGVGGSTVRIAGSEVGDIANGVTAFKSSSLATVVFTAKSGSSGSSYTFLPIIGTGGIADSDGNDLNVSSVPVTVNIRDNIAPTVSSVTTSSSGSKKAGDTVSITVNFSEAVTSTGTSSLALNSGGTATCPAVTTSSTTMVCTYNVASGQNVNRLDYVSKSALTGTIADPSGNGAVKTLPELKTSGLYSANIVIDTVPPTVALTYSLNASTYSSSLSRQVKSGDTVTVKATMTETDAFANAPTLTLTATGRVTTVSAAPMTLGSNLEYTYAYPVQAGENGTVSASVSASDTAGNLLTSTAATAFVVDNTAPTVALAYTDGGSSNPTGPYKSGDRVTVTATFTEANSISGTPTLSLVSGSFSGTLPSVTLALSTGKTYTGTFTVPAGNGTVTASVNASDAAGNTLAATAQTGFTIDNTAPTLSSVAFTDGGQSNATGPYKAGDSVTATVILTEAVALQGVPTLTLVAGTYLGGTLPSVTLSNGGSGLTYTATITVPAGNGTVTSTVTATDTAGSSLSSSGQTGFTIDNAAPSVALSYTDGGLSNATGPYKRNDSVTVTATFTDASNLAGTPTLSLSGGTYTGGSLPAVTLTVTSGKTYTGTFTIPTGNGTVTATVGAVDLAGNTLNATAQTGFLIDNSAPASFTPTITPNAGLVDGASLTLAGSASEIGLTLGSAVINQYSDASGTSLIAGVDIAVTLNLSGTAISGTKTVNAFDPGARAVRLSLVVADAAGNQTTVTSAAVTITNPATASIKYASVAHGATPNDADFVTGLRTDVNADTDVVVQVQINSAGDITSGAPTIRVCSTSTCASDADGALLTLSLVTGTKSWRGTYDVQLADTGTVIVKVDASNVVTSGPVTLATNQTTSFVVDNTPPTATISKPASTAILLKAGTPTFSAAFSEDVSDVGPDDFTIDLPSGSSISGTPTVASVTPVGISSRNFTVSVSLLGVTGDGGTNATIGLRLAASPSVKDVPGNALVATAFSSSRYKLDNTAPTPGTLAVIDSDANPSDGIVGTRSPVFTVTGVTDAGGLANIQLQYATSSQGTFVNIGTVITATATSTYALSVPTSLITVDGTYYYRARVTDVATNTSDTTSIPVVLDTTKPKARLSYVASDSPTATTGFEAVPPPVNGADFLVIQVSLEDVNDVTSVTPVVKVVLATNTFDVTMSVTDDPKIYRGSYDVPADKDIAATVSLSLTGIADIVGNIAEEVAGQFKIVNIDNTPPTFASVAPSDPAWYTSETPTFRVTFSEPVTGVTATSFSTPNMGLAVTGGPPTIANVGPPTCSNVMTVGIGLNGATGTGEASSTFTLQFTSVAGITDCAGNALAALIGQVPTGTFRLYPGSRPASNSGGGSNSNPDPAPVVPPKPVTVVTPPPVVPPPPGALPPPPPPAFESGTGNPAAAQAFSALTPERAQSLGAALSTISRESAQAFGAALGGAGTQAATALLERMSALPASDAAAIASVAGALPPGAAASFVTTLSTLPPDQIAAVAGLASSLPPGAWSQVFSAIANLSQPGSGPVSFAPPAKVEKSSSGQETVSFDLADDLAPAASMVDNGEVAGARDATATRRTVVVLIKPGQVGRINRPKSGVWPDLALPVTAGKQAGLMPIFSIPADASAFTFEPTPGNLNTVQQGSLGGGTVTPLSAPFAVAIVAPAGAGENSIGVQMPSIPVATGEVFAYLFSTGGGIGPGFTGYLRAPAEFDPSTGRQKWSIRIDEAADVLFMPVALQPAYMANFGEATHIYSNPFEGAIDFGEAGPQFTTFTVVAPQVGYRIYVYNPITKGYGWIDAREVGPTTAPAP